MKTIILNIFLFFVVISTFAQKTNEIIYLDFEPDIFSYCYLNTSTNPATGNMDSLFLDINFDSNADLLVYTQMDGIMKNPRIKPLNSNISLCSASENDTLASAVYWTPFGVYWIWSGATEKFGFRYLIDDQIHYGWFRAYKTYVHNDDGGNTNYLWIDKMAFCTIPNYPLLWGQTEISNSVPKTDAGNDGVKINFNNASNTLQIESLTKIKNVEIVSSNGQIVNKTKDVGKNETEINVYGLQNGVYIVKVVLDDGRVVSGKIVK
ncbi:MAG: T9SS type A sorting domain-containing protein [Bacteroidales bacterium]|nr:T9SS type A sorting domain-containing protein [Bacteroidales bacterium]